MVIADGTSGEELVRFNTEFDLDDLAIDEANGELVAGTSESGSITTYDVATGDVVAEVEPTSTTTRPDGGLSIRSDGLLMVVSRSQIEVVDRRAGVIGEPVQLRRISAARVRPDGSVLTITGERRVVIVDPEGNALVEQSWPIDTFAEVEFADGLAGIVRQPASDPEIIDLDTGARTTFELVRPDGRRVLPLVAIPDGEGFWTVADSPFLERWEGGELVARVFTGGSSTGNHHGDRWAIVTRENDFPTVLLVNLDSLRVMLTIPAPSVATTHPALGGGVHIFDRNGTLSTYDSDGVQIGEMAVPQLDLTPFRIDRDRVAGYPISMDPSSGRLVSWGVLGQAVIIDTEKGEVRTLPDVDSVNNVAFARNGELLVIVSSDGTVSLWDVERDRSAGTVWTGTGAYSGRPWYDETTDSVWVATSGKLIRIPLDPAGWVERSCEIVGRDFTQDEWDRFVPGDQPLRSACG